MSLLAFSDDPRVEGWFDDVLRRRARTLGPLFRVTRLVRNSMRGRHAEVLEDLRLLTNGGEVPRQLYATYLNAMAANSRAGEAVAMLEKKAMGGKDPDASEALVAYALQQHDFAAAERWGRPAAAAGHKSWNFLNNLAWAATLRGDVSDQALADARTSTELSPTRATLHTLATLHVERGELAEAHLVHLRSFENAPNKPLDGNDAYVIARIADQMGLTDLAQTGYAQTVASTSELGALAKRRLAKLPAR